jgi:hypothetical protein
MTYKKGLICVLLTCIFGSMETLSERDPEVMRGFYDDVYTLLVHTCKARESMREDFVRHFTNPEERTHQEWRFQGNMGFGGKFWRRDEGHSITLYGEDENPERLERLREVNDELAALDFWRLNVRR